VASLQEIKTTINLPLQVIRVTRKQKQKLEKKQQLSTVAMLQKQKQQSAYFG